MGARRKRAVWGLVAGGVVALVVATGAVTAGLVPGWRKPDDPEGSKQPAQAETGRELAPVSVAVTPVKIRPIQRTVQTVGSFHGFEQMTVTAEVAGRVTKIHCDVGDTVRPGDLLLEINPVDYELAVQEARTAFEAELAKLVTNPKDRQALAEELARLVRDEKTRRALAEKLTRLGAAALVEKVFDIQNLPMIRRAREQEENARRRWERAQEIRARSERGITDEEFEQRRTDYEVAQATRLQTVMEVEATLAMASYRLAMLAVAEKKLQDTKVLVPRSPMAEKAGIQPVEYSVARRRVSEGEMVKDSPSASSAVFDLVLDRLLKYVGTVPERYVGEVKVGQKVQIRVDAYPEEVFTGRITRISPTVDRLNRTFQIEAEVSNPDRKLKPGGFARGDIQTRVDPRAKTVPIDSVVTFAGSTKVFVVRDEREGKVVRAVPVALGTSGRDPDGQVWTEVIGQLQPGDLVVTTAGREQLVEGAPARIREPEHPAGPTPPSKKPTPSSPEKP
ncbi:MAG: efflux RND transporter periplasmic adaptor subunit [Thermoguttaceae bacterium]